MRELVQSDILPAIVSYLEELGELKVSQKLSNTYDIPSVKRNKFTQKTIQEIFQFYLESHPKLQKLFPDEEEEVEEVQPKKKNSKKTETKRKVSVEKSSRKQSEEVKKLKKTSVDKSSRKVSEQEPSKRKSSKEILLKNDNKQVKKNEENGEKTFFQKIDYSRVELTDSRLLDNTFEAKERYGHGDAFGVLGNQLLAPTRGKDFRKGKNKLKNKAFAGGDIKINVNQINGIKL